METDNSSKNILLIVDFFMWDLFLLKNSIGMSPGAKGATVVAVLVCLGVVAALGFLYFKNGKLQRPAIRFNPRNTGNVESVDNVNYNNNTDVVH